MLPWLTLAVKWLMCGSRSGVTPAVSWPAAAGICWLAHAHVVGICSVADVCLLAHAHNFDSGGGMSWAAIAASDTSWTWHCMSFWRAYAATTDLKFVDTSSVNIRNVWSYDRTQTLGWVRIAFWNAKNRNCWLALAGPMGGSDLKQSREQTGISEYSG